MNCTFTGNKATNEDSGQGGAIYFNSIYGNIEKCTFINNIGANGIDIYYEKAGGTSQSGGRGLTIQNNKFMHTDEIYSNSFLISIVMNSQSVLKFNNNEINIANSNSEAKSVYAFTFQNINSGTMTFENNCITPNKEYLSDNSEHNEKITESFTICTNENPEETTESIDNSEVISTIESTSETRPTDEFECPQAPENSYQISEQNTDSIPDNANAYACNLKLNRVSGKVYSLFVYKCTFKECNAEFGGGGAIRISINSATAANKNSTIYHCTFEKCSCLFGGAISILCNNINCYFEISKCTFKENKATDPDSGKAGAIHFNSICGKIDECTFINNIGINGIDICYENPSPGTQTNGRGLTIQSNIFSKTEESSTNSCIISLIWNKQAALYFNNNEINIISSNSETKSIFAFQFDGNINSGTMSFEGNCITPNKEYLSESQGLVDLMTDGFKICGDNEPAESTITEEPTNPTEPVEPTLPDENIFTEQNCNHLVRCYRNITDENLVHMQVARSSFDNFYHDENGGAIHLINCGLSCNTISFSNCSSQNGGGGGIYIYNEYDMANNVTLKDLQMTGCKAAYGAAIYIYSSSSQNKVSITHCTFTSNQVYQNEGRENTLFGGSAIFLTVKVGKVMRCKFSRNIGNGGSLKLFNNFNINPNEYRHEAKQLENNEESLLISNCHFEIDESSTSSLYYVHGNDGIKVNVKDCSFTGSLNENAHHIEEEFLIKETSKLHIMSCKFASDQTKSFNLKQMNSNSVFNHKIVENNKYAIYGSLLLALLAVSVASALIIINKKKDNGLIKEQKEESIEL